MLEHSEKKGSTALWFILAIIPIVNIYFMWKAAEEVSAHEVITQKYQSMAHMNPKDSTIKWFGIFLIPAVIGGVAAALSGFMARSVTSGGFPSGAPTTGFQTGGLFAGMGMIIWVLTIPAIIVGLYILYKTAEVVSGHDKVYETHERLEHLEKKESTGKWMVFGIIPILNLYYLWKLAETISGHESAYE